MELQITAFKNILELVRNFPTEQKCIEHLEALRWNGQIVSPFEPTSKVYKCAGGKYKCKATGKYFNVRTGTIFEDTKIPLQKWFMAIYLVANHKKGISSHQLARDLSITQKSAWFVLHRVRYAFGHENFKKEMKGTIEIDETFIGGKEENKHSNKKIKGSQGGANKAIVFGALERGGDVQAQAISERNGKTLLPIINNIVQKGAVIMSDELKSYRPLKKEYTHNHINHAGGEYVNGNIHINGIENYWSLFKRGITGIYHSISKEHLQKYVDEFSYRYNTRSMTQENRFNLFLNSTEKRLTYKQLITHE